MTKAKTYVPSLAAHLRRIAAILERHASAAGLETGAAEADASQPAESEVAPIDTLCRAFGLTPFERDVLLLCAGVELDADCASLVARLQDGGPPTFALALAALPEAHWSALLPTGPLRHWRLIEVGSGPSLVGSTLGIDERILHFLVGLQHLDERLSAIVEVATAPAELVPSQRAIAEEMAAIWKAASEDEGRMPILQLWGDDLSAQRELAASAAGLSGSSLLVLHGRNLPDDADALERLQRVWEREALLISGCLMIVADRATAGDPAWECRIECMIERAVSPLILSGIARLPPGQRTMLTFQVAKPAPEEQLGIWQQILGEERAADARDLRALIYQFDLGFSAIRAACADALGANQSGDGPPPAGEQLGRALWDSCRAQARPQLDGIARRIEPAAHWGDLVLPERERKTLLAIADQVRHRPTVCGDWGFSEKGERRPDLAVLFAGPSGTGKRLAAEVLATELRLDLYRIDLSAVVDKYIGETEKNLRQILDSAEAGGAVLLFDEADALFGKRSEVKDSHDRYANIEVNYLLQRMESYRGLAILTTNREENIDQAFLRRMRFIVRFPFPDAAMRAKIWERIFPPQTPLDALDFARLAQLEVSGGSIRDIALNAAFLAAPSGCGVSMDHVKDAARAEYARLDKTPTDAEARGWE